MSLAAAAAFAGPILGGLFSQQYEPAYHPNIARYTNVAGDKMLEEMMARYRGGAGEFGFGGMAKQGAATLGQMFQSRNLNPSSGVAMQEQGKMLGNAMSQDVLNRRNFMMQLGQAGHRTTLGQQFAGRGWV